MRFQGEVDNTVSRVFRRQNRFSFAGQGSVSAVQVQRIKRRLRATVSLRDDPHHSPRIVKSFRAIKPLMLDERVRIGSGGVFLWKSAGCPGVCAPSTDQRG